MITIRANTLEEAYSKASATLECSVTELTIEVVQNPSSGFMGMFKKEAIIVAQCSVVVKDEPKIENEPLKPADTEVKEEIEETPKENIIEEHLVRKESVKKPYVHKSTELENGFFETESNANDIVFEIQSELTHLFKTICFVLDEIKVSLYDENTVYIELSGADAALLIGKEGYRYKALSYMLFNWINSKYDMQLRLEIAEFLKNQEESIDRYLDGVCENIDRDGRAQTKILDGVLVQIALKKLRSIYPEKYVAIRTTKDGNKYIIVNHYNEY